jgi:predicted DNA-binding transcriptional regulator YafY
MATNKNALIRYLTIDKSLQNNLKKWTLNDLIDACSDALYEYEGKDSYVSKRTVQLDIQNMRSNKLGYNAPIVVYERRYYKYATPNYSITDIPINEIDLDILSESMEMLRQFKNFSLFSELNGVIQKLEDKVFRETKDQTPIIHLDNNEHLQGIEHLDTIYQAILKKMVMNITYQSFKARKPANVIFTAYILKEFNNRWFVVGRSDDSKVIKTFALDRIQSIQYEVDIPYKKPDFDPTKYYSNTYGVTVLSDKEIIDIEMKVDKRNAPYIMTKPFHHSQEMIGEYTDGSILIRLRVHHNYEIERLILGYGPAITIVKPRRLKQRIKKLTKELYGNYFET